MALTLISAILVAITGWAIFQAENAWLRTHVFVPDPASYALHNIVLHERIQTEGRLAVALSELAHNPRNPFRTVPLVLLAPALLARPLGELGTTLPMLFAFVALLGMTIYRRSGSLWFASAGMAAACSVPGYYNGTWGLGVFWLDLPAGLLIASGALALLNSRELRDLRWMALFAVLISCATLSRYVAGPYAFAACAPLLVFYAWKRIRAGEPWRQVCLRPLGITGSIVGMLAGIFVAVHYRQVAGYYSTFSYGYKSTSGSFLFTIDSVVHFMAHRGYLVLIALAAFFQAAASLRSRRDFGSLLLLWWLPCSVIAFLTCSRQVGEAVHATLYAVPLALIAALVPAASWAGKFRCPGLAAAALLSTWSAWSAEGMASSVYERGLHPAPAALAEKNADVQLATTLAALGPKVTWCTYYTERDDIVRIEAFYHTGVLLKSTPGRARFFVHDSYWEGLHPGETPGQLASSVYENAKAETDVALVPADPTRAVAAADNPRSIAVIRRFAERIPADPAWRQIFELDTPQFGRIIGYRNQARAIPPPAAS